MPPLGTPSQDFNVSGINKNAKSSVDSSYFANDNERAYADEAGRSEDVRIISKARLRLFWASPGCKAAEGPLRAWYTHVSKKAVAWHSWTDVKADFSKASLVGNCTVFNVGGNKYRLVTRILFASQKVFILKVMTHRDYDDEKWKGECGCFAPPPKKLARRKNVSGD
jgi:mRNA interferase HigB